VKIQADFDAPAAWLRTGNIPSAQIVRITCRNRTGEWLSKYIKNRVRDRGQGADGRSLQGYSTRPLRVGPATILKKRIPPGGLPQHFKGGYTEYRQAVGLPTDHFQFTNTGYSLDNFGHTVVVSPEDKIDIGFYNENSNIAANAAIENNRPEMFALGDKELDRAAGLYLECVVALVWGDLFSSSESTSNNGDVE
jgi:hypothetical protein